MVVLRLSRVGKKSHATWRLIASDKRKDTLGNYLELLGSYDPHQNPAGVQLKADRVKYWLSVGAQPSPTVHNLLVDQGILTVPKLARKMVKKPVDPAAAAAPTPSTEEKPAEAQAVSEPAESAKAEAESAAEATKIEEDTTNKKEAPKAE